VLPLLLSLSLFELLFFGEIEFVNLLKVNRASLSALAVRVTLNGDVTGILLLPPVDNRLALVVHSCLPNPDQTGDLFPLGKPNLSQLIPNV